MKMYSKEIKVLVVSGIFWFAKHLRRILRFTYSKC